MKRKKVLVVVEEVEEDEASDLHCICSKGMGAVVSLKLRITVEIGFTLLLT